MGMRGGGRKVKGVGRIVIFENVIKGKRKRKGVVYMGFVFSDGVLRRGRHVCILASGTGFWLLALGSR